MRCLRAAGAGWLLVLAGCTEPAVQPGTGAEAAVRRYYEALVRKDWAGAYAELHGESRTKYTPALFARQAESYRRQMGFEPEQVAVRACEEHGDEAQAHVVLKDGKRSYRDAIVLRRTDGGWGIVLPLRFGERR
jgi:hypothetical protein